MTEKEQLQQELNMGLFITLEGNNKVLTNEVGTILQTALKYEFKDTKFKVINSLSCSYTSDICKKLLNQELKGSTRLLLSTAIISEAVNAIIEEISNGTNVICTNFITGLVMDLCTMYESKMIVDIITASNLFLNRDSEIIIMKNDDSNNNNQNDLYNNYITKSMQSHSDNINNDTSYFRVDSFDNIDDTTNKVISIIRTRLKKSEYIKNFAKGLFGEEQPKEE
jgi:thymidylate kinase